MIYDEEADTMVLPVITEELSSVSQSQMFIDDRTDSIHIIKGYD